MASTGARVDPALAFRFEIRLDGLAAGGFSECAGLQAETEVHDYPEGGLNTHVHRFVTRTKHGNLTLRRGVVDRALWDWYAGIIGGLVVRRNGSVLVRDPSGASVVAEWQFRRAFVCKWTGPDLNATQNAVAVETFELCHEGLDRRS
ncbi:phage tail protein [Actinoplanes sp. NPDC051861]|uniref:phage tail protein n=1 Tax=Actinoplanes sp. NPDC051861 TaxID=3155170 RepID=UPI0034489E86